MTADERLRALERRSIAGDDRAGRELEALRKATCQHAPHSGELGLVGVDIILREDGAYQPACVLCGAPFGSKFVLWDASEGDARSG